MRTVTLPNEELLPEIARMLAEGNMVTLRAKGNSMLPFIVGGKDSVVLQKKDTFAIGDIVLAEVAPQVFVLHRIVNIEGEVVILMGDGNLQGTEECNKNNICGQVIAIIHNGKEIDCNSKGERRKARIWKRLLPMRRYLLAIYRRIK